MNRMRIDAGQRDTVIGFIRQNALKMLKEGGGVFAHPFIDPGAGYDYNLWDWDSYWSSSSLFSLCEYSKIKGEDNLHLCEKILRHAKGNILNFLDLLQEDGFLAMVTTKEGLFSHFLVDEHRAGKPVNQHKPFLAQSILRVSDVMGRTDWFPFEKLLRYLDFYFSNQYDTESGLFFWRNDIMIGIDNNPTVFGRPDDSVADVFLNSFLYLELKAAAELAERVKSSRAIQLKERAEHLGLAIKEHLYDERDAFFYSGDLLSKTHFIMDWDVFGKFFR